MTSVRLYDKFDTIISHNLDYLQLLARSPVRLLPAPATIDDRRLRLSRLVEREYTINESQSRDVRLVGAVRVGKRADVVGLDTKVTIETMRLESAVKIQATIRSFLTRCRLRVTASKQQP